MAASDPTTERATTEDGLKLRVILVGIGGASSSGKTTLSKYLRSILPGSIILHQDDFAPPQELIPVHPVYQVQDWDAAEGAIDWPRMVTALREVKRTGQIPPEHYSHDHLNPQEGVPVNVDVLERWKQRFTDLDRERKEKGEKFLWVLVDGFLLFWHPEVVDTLDVKILLRAPHDVLRDRRLARQGYHTAEGGFWRDPPNYWEQIVWPAYVDAHKGIVENGDVEHGKSNGKVPGLEILEGLEISMDAMVEFACEKLMTVV
ncbi:P-loop containing nucleoside triphosphate hydrolase protein [Cristinia sonorae]|uniref:P-loop containing nucleoside triphosphate hydrolase protein n=1 Tax=Cristinia sonorae TaxID=1940300 RepID=A0A8K0XVP2_9AGAR|nr:P-loop containing nucleoside triphosphate hydrolase protein [Cristinia sonorae]